MTAPRKPRKPLFPQFKGSHYFDYNYGYPLEGNDTIIIDSAFSGSDIKVLHKWLGQYIRWAEAKKPRKRRGK